MIEQEKLDLIFELLDDFTSDGKLYYDDEYESIWMINPDTKQWIFELTKTGRLWYYNPIFSEIFKYVFIEYPDFKPYITKWVERILQKEVKDTQTGTLLTAMHVERILQKEVKDTHPNAGSQLYSVERILQKEVKDTYGKRLTNTTVVERILQKEVKDTQGAFAKREGFVERILQKEVKDTQGAFAKREGFVERILQKEVKDTIDTGNAFQLDVERILQNEVKDTFGRGIYPRQPVERILQQDNNLDLNENINESEESPSVDEDLIFELLDDFTSGGKLYYDDIDESIWMINPDTKQWIFEFEKSGNLWYYNPIFSEIFKYVFIEYPDFIPYITKWVERILQKEVKDTIDTGNAFQLDVERILQNEVKDTKPWQTNRLLPVVERILQQDNNLDLNENINESEKMKKTNSMGTILKSFEIRDSLPSEIWYNPDGKSVEDSNASDLKLKPEIRQRLLEIAELFVDYIKLDIFVNDIVITGSLLNYNWSNYSDFDLHVITSLSNYQENKEIYKEFFNLKKNSFNLKHDITVKGYDVEVYVEDSDNERFSSGVYSIINDKWVNVPKKEKATIDLNKIKEKTNQWMELIDNLIDTANDEDIYVVKSLFDKYGEKLKSFRTAGLKKGGEYSYENLVFKVLRRNGYLDKFRNAADKIIDKQLTLKESEIF